MVPWLRSALFFAFGLTSVAIYGTFALLVFWAPQDFLWRIVVNYCHLALWAGDFFCGVKVVVEGEENLPDEPSVIMIKHTSTLETYGHVPMFPRTSWVVKREVIWMPVFGWVIGLLFQPIAIHRGARSAAVRQVISQGKERLRKGFWVTVFPEGTRLPPGETRRYGISGAALAQEANAPIVPVAHNAGDVWPRRGFVKRPGTVRFVIGPAISAQGRPPRETNLIVQDWIEGKMREISAAYGAPSAGKRDS